MPYIFFLIGQVPGFWKRIRKHTPIPCVHCKHLKKLDQLLNSTDQGTPSLADDENDEMDTASSPLRTTPPPPQSSPPPYIVFSPAPSPPPQPSVPPFEFELPSVQLQPPDDMAMSPQRRRSISRQEALFVEPTGKSLENVCAVEEMSKDNNIYLAVPELKRDRAASIDSSFSNVSGARSMDVDGDGIFLTVPGTSQRSQSVDIVLPTVEHARYKALALISTQLPSPISPEGEPKFPQIRLDTRLVSLRINACFITLYLLFYFAHQVLDEFMLLFVSFRILLIKRT